MRFQNKDPKILLDGVRVVVQRGTVVTAAHNICRKETRFHAVDVLICIGYEGARCAPENRMGYQRSESAGIHWGHFAAGNEKYEIAVLHLQAPFEDSRPIIWGKAPTKGKETKIKVVGYPSDVPKHGEGQTMHVSECPIAVHDLQVDEYRMKYYLHTCRGDSGGSVLQVGHDEQCQAIELLYYDGNIIRAGCLGHQGNDIPPV